MAKFRDRAGDEWGVEITIGDLDALRAAGLDLGKVGSDPAALDVLDTPETVGKVLWVLCGEQAEKRGLSPEQFARRFNGPTLFAAGDAVTEAVADFSQRPAVAAAIRSKLPGAMARLDAVKIAAWETVLEKVGTTPSGSTGSAGNSPASPGSTPAG